MRHLVFLAALLSAVPSGAATLRTFEKQFHGTGVARTAVDASAAVIENENENGSLMKLAVYSLVLPFAFSAGIEAEGYSPGLYADSKGDMGEAPSQHRLELGYQRVGRYVDGWTGRWRFDTERHVGFEAFWTDYLEHNERDLHYVGASALGDFHREEKWRADYQLGLAALSGKLTRVGPRLAAEAELYPRKPFFLDCLAAVTLIDGGPLGELRVGGGAAWRRAQARLSYRALIGPFKNLAGPELALIFRL